MTAKKHEHIPVDSIRHSDKRANIPTEELRDFIAEEETAPAYVAYPRDPSLDPQLVWKGKDEQDSKDLEVPAVPIYVQEKIHPQALIENLRETAGQGQREPELTLFDDYDGLEFEDLIDFYHHEQNWSNRLILGDSLLVMTSLAEKEGLKGQVQMIYMDPPYGIKFGSNWQVSTRKRDLTDGKAEDLTRQPEQIRAFRDTWQYGIHSYLAYLRDRLLISRELLADTGSVFVQIGDENVHLVRSVLDEVFGSENYIALINYTKTSGQTARYLPVTTDYIMWYAKNAEMVKYRALFYEKSLGGAASGMYQYLELADGTRRRLTNAEIADPALLPPGARPFRLGDVTSQRQGRPSGPGTAMYFPVKVDGRDYFPPGTRGWTTTAEGMNRLSIAGRLVAQGERISYMRYLDDFAAVQYDNNWTDSAGVSDRVYVVQTNVTIAQRCMLMTTDPGDLVLDPTCGSGTTAFVAEQWGRRWITIDTSRVALALARTRFMAGRYPYYLLADSDAGARKQAEISGAMPSLSSATGDIRKGFVYKRVRHVTLKCIASNPEIQEGMSREGIEAAISRSADSELLYDQPFEDNSRIRVAGPFTVESLSPHRVLTSDESAPLSEPTESGAADFTQMIISNLRKAGVQNTRRAERLEFDAIESYAGEWVHAIGEYKDSLGATKRAAISVGPEYGTVGADHVKQAAKEAMRGISCDLLLVLGFSFDAHAPETASEISPKGEDGREGFALMVAEKQLGRLPVQLVRMNPDLAMGDDLLKRTGAGNLFMIFGEPDVQVLRNGGKLEVEIHGVDVYDPTTGVIRNSSSADIACWFIDTNYNEESFFVRHAYFTGAGDPYSKLKKALRAEIDEAAWSSLYSTTSRPFDPPTTGKIAIKVINHYGDEVMKVYEC